MEEIYNDTNYKSGWRPLAREDGLVTESTYLAPETSRKKEKVSEKVLENVGKPDEAAEAAEQSEIIRKLSVLCEDIDTLSHRIHEQDQNINLLSNRIQDQGEKLETLMSLLGEKGPPAKKSSFWK